MTEANSWVDSHISASLEDMGHTVFRFYYGDFIGEFYGKSRYAEQIEKNKQLVLTANQLLQNNHLNLIFCYVQDDFLIPEYAHQLAKLDLPFVVYNVDMACQWYRLTRTAKYFSRILCAQPDNMSNISRYNPNVLYFPMAARKSLLANNNQNTFEPHASVTFLGTPTLYRLQILSLLIQANTPLAIYGKYWKTKQIATPSRNIEKTIQDIWHYGAARLRGEGILPLYKALKRRLVNNKNTLSANTVPSHIIHEFLPDDAIGPLFQLSKINLGFTRTSENHPHQRGSYQMRLRDFEVPYTGGFYLVEKAPGYETFYSEGREVVTWSTPEDLIDKISYYLSHEKEREAIAKAGQQRALAEHTWEHRFNMLFQELGIKY